MEEAADGQPHSSASPPRRRSLASASPPAPAPPAALSSSSQSPSPSASPSRRRGSGLLLSTAPVSTSPPRRHPPPPLSRTRADSPPPGDSPASPGMSSPPLSPTTQQHLLALLQTAPPPAADATSPPAATGSAESEASPPPTAAAAMSSPPRHSSAALAKTTPPSPPSAQSMRSETGARLAVGDLCLLDNTEACILRYLGRTSFAQKGMWCGIELFHPRGRNDGSVDGIEYFRCQANFGLFVRPGRLFPLAADQSATLDDPETLARLLQTSQSSQPVRSPPLASQRSSQPQPPTSSQTLRTPDQSFLDWHMSFAGAAPLSLSAPSSALRSSSLAAAPGSSTHSASLSQPSPVERLPPPHSRSTPNTAPTTIAHRGSPTPSPSSAPAAPPANFSVSLDRRLLQEERRRCEELEKLLKHNQLMEQERLKRQAAESQLERTAWTSRLAKEQHRNQEADRQLARLSSVVQSLEEQLQQVSAARAEARRQADERSNELHLARRELRRLSNASLSASAADTPESPPAAGASLAALQREVTHLRQQLETVQERLRHENEARLATAEALSETAALLQDKQKHVDAYKEQNNTLLVAQQAVRGDVERKEREIASLQTALRQAQLERDHARQTAAVSPPRDLEAKTAELDKQRQALAAERRHLDAWRQELDAAATLPASEVAAAESASTAALTARLRHELEDERRQRQQLEAELAHARAAEAAFEQTSKARSGLPTNSEEEEEQEEGDADTAEDDTGASSRDRLDSAASDRSRREEIRSQLESIKRARTQERQHLEEHLRLTEAAVSKIDSRRQSLHQMDSPSRPRRSSAIPADAHQEVAEAQRIPDAAAAAAAAEAEAREMQLLRQALEGERQRRADAETSLHNLNAALQEMQADNEHLVAALDAAQSEVAAMSEAAAQTPQLATFTLKTSDGDDEDEGGDEDTSAAARVEELQSVVETLNDQLEEQTAAAAEAQDRLAKVGALLEAEMIRRMTLEEATEDLQTQVLALRVAAAEADETGPPASSNGFASPHRTPLTLNATAAHTPSGSSTASTPVQQSVQRLRRTVAQAARVLEDFGSDDGESSAAEAPPHANGFGGPLAATTASPAPAATTQHARSPEPESPPFSAGSRPSSTPTILETTENGFVQQVEHAHPLPALEALPEADDGAGGEGEMVEEDDKEKTEHAEEEEEEEEEEVFGESRIGERIVSDRESDKDLVFASLASVENKEEETKAKKEAEEDAEAEEARSGKVAPGDEGGAKKPGDESETSSPATGAARKEKKKSSTLTAGMRLSVDNGDGGPRSQRGQKKRMNSVADIQQSPDWSDAQMHSPIKEEDGEEDAGESAPWAEVHERHREILEQMGHSSSDGSGQNIGSPRPKWATGTGRSDSAPAEPSKASSATSLTDKQRLELERLQQWHAEKERMEVVSTKRPPLPAEVTKEMVTGMPDLRSGGRVGAAQAEASSAGGGSRQGGQGPGSNAGDVIDDVLNEVAQESRDRCNSLPGSRRGQTSGGKFNQRQNAIAESPETDNNAGGGGGSGDGEENSGGRGDPQGAEEDRQSGKGQGLAVVEDMDVLPPTPSTAGKRRMSMPFPSEDFAKMVAQEASKESPVVASWFRRRILSKKDAQGGNGVAGFAKKSRSASDLHLGAKPSTIMEEDGDDSVVMALAKKPRPSILKKAAHPLPSGKGNSASARKPVHPMDKLRDLSARIEDDPGSVSDAVHSKATLQRANSWAPQEIDGGLGADLAADEIGGGKKSRSRSAVYTKSMADELSRAVQDGGDIRNGSSGDGRDDGLSSDGAAAGLELWQKLLLALLVFVVVALALY